MVFDQKYSIMRGLFHASLLLALWSRSISYYINDQHVGELGVHNNITDTFCKSTKNVRIVIFWSKSLEAEREDELSPVRRLDDLGICFVGAAVVRCNFYFSPYLCSRKPPSRNHS